MRTIVNLIQTFKKCTNKAHPAYPPVKLFYDNIQSFKPFVFDNNSVDNLGYLDRPSLDINNSYLPFAATAFDFLQPVALPQKIKDQAGALKDYDDAYIFGSLAFEQNDLSIKELLITANRHKHNSSEENDFFNMRKPVDRCVAISQEYENYEQFYIGSFSRIFLKALDSKNIKYGETRFLSAKRVGRDPDYVNKVIVITGITNTQVEEPIRDKALGKIDWKHQWRVRGHWRKISDRMIGKDREGEYCIVGRTWVKDFVKGDGPLIEKTRIHKGEKNVWSKQGNSSGEIGPRP
jgi:hypothetical protein